MTRRPATTGRPTPRCLSHARPLTWRPISASAAVDLDQHIARETAAAYAQHTA